MKKLLTPLLMGFLLIGQIGLASSVPILKARCNEDSLDPGQSTERIEWAAKCGHITQNERQYSLYDGSNPRPRPLYPIFGKEDMSELWKAPVSRSAPCTVPPGKVVIAFCTASCYTPDQQVLFPEGYVDMESATKALLPDVMVVRDGSTLEDVRLISYPVESYTSEIRPNTHNILIFRTESGGELKVTKNHPIVAEDGSVKTADKFRVGDSLIHYLHGPDPIVRIHQRKFFGKVYNLAPATRLPISNIVVAQGYLNGSSYFQNDGSDLQNRRLLRRTLPDRLVK